MSEPKLISPLLDGFAIGSAISDHDGVRCYPAMREDSDEKYIVKIISIPASSRQLDALLLSGAYTDAQAAQGYFESLVSDIENEAQVLRHFAKLEGFFAYEDYQVVPHDDGIGFDVYLLGTYKRTLAKFFSKQPMTHLGAINLGIDLCAAMTVCRQAGCLYIDLKPENIFITNEGRYCVGDLGFVPLSSLKYATVPDKYRSSYTAPEMADPFITLNTSLDIYAIGLILYQAYNNNTLPFNGNAPTEVLPPPEYADYEMAEIILKACAPDPAARWSDPKELGQALVTYMQRNGANNVPIVPPAVSVIDDLDPAPAEDFAADEDAIDDLGIDEVLATGAEELINADQDDDVSADELSEILAHAEELLAHELPAPAVAPEPIEIPIPAPITPEQDADEEESELDADDAMLPNIEVGAAAAPVIDETDDEEDNYQIGTRKSGTLKAVFGWILAIVILAGIAFGGYYFYTNYFLQEIDNLSVEGKDTSMTVHIGSQIEDELLTAYCTDTYGTVTKAPVENGRAVFTDLIPGSQYTIHVEIDGFHRLIGNTSASYATPLETNIQDFAATIGSEDGSVILSFTVTGQDTDTWSIVYSTEGEEERSIAFSGHSTTVSGLTVGKEYTFRLVSDDELYLIGTTELTFVAPKLVFAEELAVTGFDGSNLTVSWKAPADAAVSKWNVRCYNDNGFDVTIEAADTSVTLANVDTSAANTIEVTAEGMTQCVRTFITADPISITKVNTDNTNPNDLSCSWEFVGKAPAGGWLLSYTVDGSDIESVVQCTENSAEIKAVIPGATYHFTIQAANGVTLLNGTFDAVMPEAVGFTGYDVSWKDMTFSMCWTPDVADWDRTDLSDDDYTTTFAVGDKASFLVYLNREYNIAYEEITTLFVIQDKDGKIISANTSTREWVNMWYRGYCELDIPALPEVPGEYTVDIYFNGMSVTTESFTMQ